MVSPDAFTRWFQSHRPEDPPQVYQPAAFLGGPVLGWSLRFGDTHLVYRIPPDEPEVLYIVLIERGTSRQNLRSPFAAIVRFLSLVQESQCGVRWIRGHVEPSRRRPDDALSRERILAFYQRYLTAVSVGVENGIEWFGGDLQAFSWSQEKRKIRRSAHLNR